MRLIPLTLVAVACCAASSQMPANQSFAGKARALDGDTVAVDFRLLGVDAFEGRQLCQRDDGCWRCGKAAQDLAARTLQSKTAVIRLTSASSYGRPVATVTVNGEDLGERLLRAGLAIPELQYLRADPVRAARYRTVFAQARSSKAGAFAGRWIEPSRWRHGERLQCER